MMIEYMNFRCSECGNWLDCTREEFESKNGLCEECYEDSEFEDED